MDKIIDQFVFKNPVDPFEELCAHALLGLGEDPSREGLQRTPHRFRKALKELTAGYQLTPQMAVGEGIFQSESTGPIFVKKIEFYSLCEHHMLPFWGEISIGYIPNDKILGLSKLARVVEVFARRLQVQERLTREVAVAIQELVGAKAVAVVCEASHMCMMMRGVKKQESLTRTEYNLGLEKLPEFDRGRFLQGVDP
jgi:GTP cyclohydrolase I